MREVVAKLRQKGFLVLMDDFGSGYSSLNMLHELNIDMIKIDAHFLKMNKGTVRKGMHILESVVNMAKTIGLPIIVEGVESKKESDYLMNLGCRYIQGFYFYKPMSKEEFEKLIVDPENVDPRGFVFKANEEFHIKEFFSDSVYTDSMLNSILGPAAIYAVQDEHVDIVRFNQQFYKAVNDPHFNERLADIQRFMPAKDAKQMADLMEQAVDDPFNGSTGIMTFYRTDGEVARFLIHFYFLEDSSGLKRFFGAARDVTELTELNMHMQLLSKYSSNCLVFVEKRQKRFTFSVGAVGVMKEFGYTAEELEKELTESRFRYRVLPEDHEKMKANFEERMEKGKDFRVDFRMKEKNLNGDMPVLSMRGIFINEEDSDVKCILSISRKNEE